MGLKNIFSKNITLFYGQFIGGPRLEELEFYDIKGDKYICGCFDGPGGQDEYVMLPQRLYDSSDKDWQIPEYITVTKKEFNKKIKPFYITDNELKRLKSDWHKNIEEDY